MSSDSAAKPAPESDEITPIEAQTTVPDPKDKATTEADHSKPAQPLKPHSGPQNPAGGGN